MHKVKGDEGSLPVVKRLEFIERTQFYDKKGEGEIINRNARLDCAFVLHVLGLPMYACKWEIVEMIKNNGCCIVKVWQKSYPSRAFLPY
jgi:hypothetical protein